MSEIRHLFCWKGITNTKGVNIMENVHRNDIQNFFIDMKTEEQQVAIRYLQKIIKKPPDCNQKELQEVAEHEESTA